MSDRGSFVTEYMYCPKCAEKIKEILKRKSVNFRSLDNTDSFGNMTTLIISGYLSSTYSGGEIIEFQYGEHDVIFNKDNAPCHPVRFAVLAEVGQKFFVVNPNGEIEDLDQSA